MLAKPVPTRKYLAVGYACVLLHKDKMIETDGLLALGEPLCHKIC